MKRFIALFATALVALGFYATAQETEKQENEFAKLTIDLGCVVSDIDASVKFYTEAIGFTESGGFEVSPEFCKSAGLTDSKKVDVKVLTLGKGDGATSLKLMQIEGESAKSDNDYINSTLGFSYLTIVVKSTDAALARLEKAGVKPVADGPITLPENINPDLALTIVRDPDGNLIELIGPNPTK